MLSVVTAFTMIIGASYAWLTLSESPAVNGINVSIGGGNTILLAPDLTEVIDGVIVHYPGAFDETLHLSQYDTYQYLNDLAALSPVSTADGIYWMIPVYEKETGKLKDISEFTVDSTLAYANRTEDGEGAYVCLDFWIVSPGSEYDVHVAMDTKSKEGSYLIELPSVTETESGSYTLGETTDHAASVARIGFLVNSDMGNTEGMNAYSQSEDFDKRFKSLRGVYQEPGEAVNEALENRFTIYEPNAVSHPFMEEQDGTYMETRPLIYDVSIQKIAEMDVSPIVTAQQESTWRMLDGERWIEQLFQASIVGKEELTAESAEDLFYKEYLSGQMAPYVSAGDFYDNIESGECAGATEDVVITSLERNTPQRIRMFIWLEGQDADCTNTASVPASTFSLGVELSGETK